MKDNPEAMRVYNAIWEEMEGMLPEDAALVLARLLVDWEAIAVNCDIEHEFFEIVWDGIAPETEETRAKMN